MGAWDSGPFDNDDALDFVQDVCRAPSWDAVERALTVAVAQTDYLQASDGSATIAAAALIAMSDPHWPLRVEPKAEVLYEQLGPIPRPLVEVAKCSVMRVLGPNSELADLWADDEPSEWREVIGLIIKKSGSSAVSPVYVTICLNDGGIDG